MSYKKLKYWFDKDLAELLSTKICAVEANFKGEAFIQQVTAKVESLELKDRVELIADELFKTFDKNFIKGRSILIKILGPENEQEIGMFKEFYWVMPIAKYVEKYGLAHFEESMKAIEEITKRNTGEYAIRAFVEEDSKRTIKQMKEWSLSTNKHVRRLSSEGLRPRLPWAKKLDLFIQEPQLLLPILNNLKDDKSKYVQKSVANCINDIFKDNLEVGKEIIENWNTDNIGTERKWIIKHALRNLLKADDAWAKEMIE